MPPLSDPLDYDPARRSSAQIRNFIDNLKARLSAVVRRRRLMGRLFELDGGLTADGRDFFGMLADAAELGSIGMAESERAETWRAARQSLVREVLQWMDRTEMDLIQERLNAAQYKEVEN